MPGQVTGPWEEAFGHPHKEVWRGVVSGAAQASVLSVGPRGDIFVGFGGSTT